MFGHVQLSQWQVQVIITSIILNCNEWFLPKCTFFYYGAVITVDQNRGCAYLYDGGLIPLQIIQNNDVVDEPSQDVNVVSEMQKFGRKHFETDLKKLPIQQIMRI